MCSLCGILGCDDHWTNAVDRPGVYTRNRDSQSRRSETLRRLNAANSVLSYRRLKLDLWQGRSYVLSSPTGASSVFEALSHLWPEAETLAGRDFDPLDENLISWMEEHRS
ncbi:hypothetical protein TG4357_03047 [Thalassovita gelatinovora]|uniref:Uncharacterized protein n=1 Tax=Thalassovita gelatinovora TaxID=53501 RepID=A0A0P1FHQ4_THAGE|nr:hypothetical protein [Thalassovita gelatinovora]QIZ82027.1 hypothetical protein HFZ77_16855 [Thalassovita gelatinovora]CUH67502.1 hypothetical protein TG4357_03047 [Thalassovita gelatinovora]SEP72803.1 hypothetical protein SAMN04488043_101213 [Thalassovita gelatinovora]